MGDLLNETFIVYGRGFWTVIGLAALLHAPMGVVSLLLVSGLVEPDSMLVAGAVPHPALVVVSILQFLAVFYVYGAISFATGQLYVTGRMSVAISYYRVWWRVLSLSSLSLLVLVTVTLSVALFFLVAPLLLLIVLLVYWTCAVPVIVVEGNSAIGALRRSSQLVRGSWWRVFGISLVVGLVTVGLAITASLPFMAIDALAGLVGLDGLGAQILGMGGIAGGVVAAPVAAISGTLLYYDLRVRKEGFDLSSLSAELGYAPAEDREDDTEEEEVTIHSKGVGQS